MKALENGGDNQLPAIPEKHSSERVIQIEPTAEEIKENPYWDVLVFFDKKGTRYFTRLVGMFAKGAFGRYSLRNQDLQGLKVDEVCDFHAYRVASCSKFFHL